MPNPWFTNGGDCQRGRRDDHKRNHPPFVGQRHVHGRHLSARRHGHTRVARRWRHRVERNANHRRPQHSDISCCEAEFVDYDDWPERGFSDNKRIQHPKRRPGLGRRGSIWDRSILETHGSRRPSLQSSEHPRRRQLG